ncbi:MAG: hypothetical protein HUU47_06610 [Bacteroidetes bacterium]|nr:hypothetical protein [Bacteroidota bacterium]
MAKFKISSLIIWAFIILISITSGCKNKYQVEISMIDSLISKNKKASDYINIDLITINQRRIEIKAQLAVLENFKPDSSVVEFESNLIKYKAIYKAYRKFIENFDLVHSKVKLNEKQLAALKNSLVDEKITAEEFKNILEVETYNVNDNLSNAEVLGNTIFKLEPDYQRLSKYFDQVVEKLIKNSPELKKIMDENTEK